MGIPERQAEQKDAILQVVEVYTQDERELVERQTVNQFRANAIRIMTENPDMTTEEVITATEDYMEANRLFPA